MRKKDIRDPVKKFPKNCNFHVFFRWKNEWGWRHWGKRWWWWISDRRASQICVLQQNTYRKLAISDGFHRSLIINILEKENHRYQPLLSASISFLMYRRTKKRVHIEFWWRMWLQDKVDTFFTRTFRKRLFSYLLFAQCLLSCPSTICSMKCGPFSSKNNFPFIPFAPYY